jgi:hypothetical protein
METGCDHGASIVTFGTARAQYHLRGDVRIPEYVFD